MSDKIEVAYICDREACGDNCSFPTCCHITEIEHAKNFKRLSDEKYIEVRGIYCVPTEEIIQRLTDILEA